MMFARFAEKEVLALLDQHAVVGLLGPRQSGKTTLALEIARSRSATYLDLESPSDRAKLADPEYFFRMHAGELVILDEVQRMPGLFEVLRGEVDRGRRAGRAAGQFLVLGSASVELLRQASESLAGRIVYRELTPLLADEVGGALETLWVRGGFPQSYLAAGDEVSMEWRRSFLRTYLERDVPQMGFRMPAETLRRFWTMLAHEQGAIFNAARLAAAIGISGQTVGRYLDLMVDLLLVRRLAPWSMNTKKRLVRSPKAYVRDSGLVHALLGLSTFDAVLGHPVAGASWEGFVIENLIAASTEGTEVFFYRTSAGAEVDLILEFAPGRLWAIEIKRSLAPAVSKGFHSALRDLKPGAAWVVYPGGERYSTGPGIEVIPLVALMAELRGMRPGG